MISLLALATGAAALPDDGTIAYVVKSGDTLSALTQSYLLPEHGWRDLMQLASVSRDRRLPTGKTIQIPRGWLRWVPEKAEVASARGQVTVRMDGKPVTAVGAVLGEGAEIETAADSFATLLLTNGSKVTLPSRSQMRIARLRRFIINGAIDYRFALKDGRIDTKVAPLKDPSGRYIIATPLAMTAVRGTDYGVAFDAPSKGTATEVFEGTVAVSPPTGAAPLLVPEKFGATTDAEGKSAKVELLPTPALNNPGRVQSEDLVNFDVTPVSGAVGYRILLATDAGFVDAFREATSATPHFEIADVPNGNQFVRISAMAGNGLEGLRQSYSFSRRLASIHAEVGATPDGYRFKWFGAGEGQRHYRLEIFRDKAEGTPVVDEVGLSRSEVTIRGLPDGVYYWRVTLSQTDSQGLIENTTQPEKLTIAGAGAGGR